MSNLMCDRMCTVSDCPTRAYKREMCQAHYRRWRLFGDPLGGDWAYKRPAAADIQAHLEVVTRQENCRRRSADRV